MDVHELAEKYKARTVAAEADSLAQDVIQERYDRIRVVRKELLNEFEELVARTATYDEVKPSGLARDMGKRIRGTNLIPLGEVEDNRYFAMLSLVQDVKYEVKESVIRGPRRTEKYTPLNCDPSDWSITFYVQEQDEEKPHATETMCAPIDPRGIRVSRFESEEEMLDLSELYHAKFADAVTMVRETAEQLEQEGSLTFNHRGGGAEM